MTKLLIVPGVTLFVLFLSFFFLIRWISKLKMGAERGFFKLSLLEDFRDLQQAGVIPTQILRSDDRRVVINRLYDNGNLRIIPFNRLIMRAGPEYSYPYEWNRAMQELLRGNFTEVKVNGYTFTRTELVIVPELPDSFVGGVAIIAENPPPEAVSFARPFSEARSTSTQHQVTPTPNSNPQSVPQEPEVTNRFDRDEVV